MSLSHRVGSTAGSPAGAPDAAPGSPPAVRDRSSRWADPRLWAGVLLVLASVVIGAKLLATADDTVAVWRVETDLVAGSSVGSGDVQVTSVRFSDPADAKRYVSAARQLPADAMLTRDVGAGELLAASAITADGVTQPGLLPVAVAEAGVPAGLATGDHVDVWAVPATDSTRTRPVSVLSDVAVAAVSGSTIGGLGGDRQILISLPDGTDVARVLAALHEASVVLVQKSA